MLFFLDTNIFYGDWFVRSANFRYLFHYLNNEGHHLLISRAVLQEVENIQNRELESAIAEAKKQLAAAEKCNGRSVVADELTFCSDAYDFLGILGEKAESTFVVEYDSIPQSTVVARAIKRIRPFQDSEKGYRDTLIWLSLLEHLKLNPRHEPIVFISSNKSDFFDPSAKQLAFHPDLVEDLRKLDPTPAFHVYQSLFDFVNKTVDKGAHAIDHTKAEDSFGEYIEAQGLAHIEAASTDVLEKLQAELTPGDLAPEFRTLD